MTRILILGGKSRLGAALARKWSSKYTVSTLARPQVDASNLPALEHVLASASFDVLVNAIALTNVDLCETARQEAATVNTLAPGVMARAAASKGARFIHVSTDYVFDGAKTAPYLESDPANPLGQYGRTKLDGEQAALFPSSRNAVLRVSWLFGPDKPSFVDMIVERALAHDKVEAIADKTSSPTFAEDMAGWIEPFFKNDLPGGLYHMCNTGSCSWQEYGQYALDCAAASGLPLRTRTVDPIPLSAMTNFVAPRPPHTAMNTTKLASTTGLVPRPWKKALHDYISTKFS